jgi:hypothetical protein
MPLLPWQGFSHFFVFASPFAASGIASAPASGGGDVPGAGSNSIWNTSSVAATDIDLLSLANVPPGSPKMWVHVASTYLITILALKVGR